VLRKSQEEEKHNPKGIRNVETDYCRLRQVNPELTAAPLKEEKREQAVCKKSKPE
jgi:hypothetical protein